MPFIIKSHAWAVDMRPPLIRPSFEEFRSAYDGNSAGAKFPAERRSDFQSLQNGPIENRPYATRPVFARRSLIRSANLLRHALRVELLQALMNLRPERRQSEAAALSRAWSGRFAPGISVVTASKSRHHRSANWPWSFPAAPFASVRQPDQCPLPAASPRTFRRR